MFGVCASSKLAFVFIGIAACLFDPSSSENADFSFPVYKGDTRPGDVWPKPQFLKSTLNVR